MIFCWNGNKADPFIKSSALSSAYELESVIKKGGQNLLKV